MDTNQQKVIVGLGNPGPRYARHRHNVGFMVVEALAARLGLAFRTPDAAYAVAVGEGIVLLKPLTYMNRSGEAWRCWAEAVGWAALAADPDPHLDPHPDPDPDPDPDPTDLADVPGEEADPGAGLLVVCDDLTLPLGSVRLRPHGSSGGQNGLASIIAEVGSERIARLRLGVAPLAGPVPPEAWADYVLSDFEAAEEAAAGDLVEWAVETVLCWQEQGLDAAVSRFNRRIRPEA